MDSTKAVAIDCETTGVYNKDRIVEIAAVQVDLPTGEIIDEWETLINPCRDVGPTDIHGVTPSMVSAAPTFDEIAPALARRLQGAVLIAHNLSFDGRFVTNEFSRAGTQFDKGSGICTLSLTSEKLGLACERHGIGHDAHRALSDARAAAQLAVSLHEAPAKDTAPCHIGYVEYTPTAPRTLRRPSGHGAKYESQRSRVVSLSHYPFSDEALLQYIDVLDWVLDDHLITTEERSELGSMASSLGLNEKHVRRAHQDYFDCLVAAALRDHIVTSDEHCLLESLAQSLGLEGAVIPAVTELPSIEELAPGTRVCFTGTAVVTGEKVSREHLERCSALAGLVPVNSVTKSGCDLLVAPDPSTSSGKTAKARKYGIAVMSATEFLGILDV